MKRLISHSRQGDLGEASAIEWLTRQGAVVFTPIGHSPDVDLIAMVGPRFVRVEVKTSASYDGRRWSVGLATRGGNRGRKYAEYEIEAGAAFDPTARQPLVECDDVPGEYRSGQTGCAVNALAQSFAGSNPASPTRATRTPVRPTRYERKLGRAGQAVINQKRRLTIPQQPFFEAGFENGSRVRVRATGPGRVVVEQVELPAWARPARTPENDEGPRPGGPSGASSPFGSR